MNLKVFSIYSPELPLYGVDAPTDVDNFCVYMCADIGTEDEDGVESFGFHVTTRTYLDGLEKSDIEISDKTALVIARFSWSTIEEALNDICSKIEEKNWSSAFDALSKRFDTL